MDARIIRERNHHMLAVTHVAESDAKNIQYHVEGQPLLEHEFFKPQRPLPNVPTFLSADGGQVRFPFLVDGSTPIGARLRVALMWEEDGEAHVWEEMLPIP